MSRGKKEIQPNWRPNFRIPGTLPDIKVVRTDFIVNSIAIVFAVATLFFLLQREYRAFSLKSSIGDLEQRIRISEADDNNFLKLNERFREAARHIEDLQSFYRAPFTPHELLSDLTLAKPEEMLFSRVALMERVAKEGDKEVTYEIVIGGEVADLEILNEFKSALVASQKLYPEGFQTEIVESFETKNADTGLFPCLVTVRIGPVDEKQPGEEGES